MILTDFAFSIQIREAKMIRIRPDPDPHYWIGHNIRN